MCIISISQFMTYCLFTNTLSTDYVAHLYDSHILTAHYSYLLIYYANTLSFTIDYQS